MASHQQHVTLVPAESFARTYSGRAYDDPWQAVLDFRNVIHWSERHPEHGAAAISRQFDIPKARVQAWLDRSRPQPVRGLEAAIDRDWIDVEPDSDRFRGLNALVAWVIQAGSITADTWVPYFSVGSELDRELLSAGGNLAGVGLDTTRAASAIRNQEMRPIQHGSVLGRALVVLGAPQGDERAVGDIQLPAYLDSVPERLGQEFVQLYIHHLGRNQDDRFYIHLPNNRHEGYVKSVAQLVRRLTGENVSVISQNVVLSKPATREVAVWDPLLDVG